jgi:hypothetical protein
LKVLVSCRFYFSKFVVKDELLTPLKVSVNDAHL